MTKYRARCSMTVYYAVETVEADSLEEADSKMSKGWCEGLLNEDSQEFRVDSLEELIECCVCGVTEDKEHIILVTDHPNCNDGDYCKKCNPYNEDKEDPDRCCE